LLLVLTLVLVLVLTGLNKTFMISGVAPNDEEAASA